MSGSEDTNDQPITPNMVIKWGGIVSAIVTFIISIVWFAAGTKQDIAIIRAEQQSQRDYMAMRKDINEKRFASLEARADQSEKNFASMETKLDIAVTLLERIDKKVGQP